MDGVQGFGRVLLVHSSQPWRTTCPVKVNPFAYSFGMAIFVSRLFTETFTRGREHWYEMVIVIVLTIVLHLINKNKNWIIKKIKSYGA